jgi:hypothetical protein
MNEKQSAERQTRPAPRERAAADGRNEPVAQQEPGERKPSKIELREWRGSGVCGDRHTD